MMTELLSEDGHIWPQVIDGHSQHEDDGLWEDFQMEGVMKGSCSPVQFSHSVEHLQLSISDPSLHQEDNFDGRASIAINPLREDNAGRDVASERQITSTSQPIDELQLLADDCVAHVFEDRPSLRVCVDRFQGVVLQQEACRAQKSGDNPSNNTPLKEVAQESEEAPPTIREVVPI